MDRITSSLLEEFSATAGISSHPEERRFEHFAAYLALSKFHSETFDTADVVTGSGGDTGIDAAGILVNGALVTDSETVEELVETNGFLDATFVFVQAERSSSFETAKIGQFGHGVLDFFAEKPTLQRNLYVQAAADVMNAVYERSSKFKRGNPACRLFYVTTGKWTDDANLTARLNGVRDELEKLGIFREVEVSPVGADAIQKLYNQTKNAISREFTFAAKTVVPEIPGVHEAYLGLLPAQEFVRLLDDGSGGILKSIFYDNVRDWQDYNPVNSEIRNTLTEGTDRNRFALMNNGVTVIAKTLRSTGNRIYIEDYQIVNGCQTSHVLFENRVSLDDSVHVPLRLIATQDEDVIAAIVKATNRQTEVREEQLIALSDFQKKLEAYFQAFPANQKLFYERRSRQYAAIAGVEKTRVVTMGSLIRAFAAIFLEEPHRTTRNYRALLEGLGKTIFAPDDRLEPYYFAAGAMYRLEFLFRNGSIDPKFKPARYHILLAARSLLQSGRPPRTGSREMARYCEPLTPVVWDPAAERLFADAAAIVDAAAQGNFHRDHIRTQPFTEALKRQCASS
jgi:hypothetical protein